MRSHTSRLNCFQVLRFSLLYLLIGCFEGAVFSDLSQSILARSLLKEMISWREAYITRSNSCARNSSIWITYHKATKEIATFLNGDASLAGVRVAGQSTNGPCDLDMEKYSSAIGPDSFYQTLMSEHSFLILMGFLVENIYPMEAFVGTCSWKATQKGRPIPCENFRLLNLSHYNANNNSVVYWGPHAGPVSSLDTFQGDVAKFQPGKENLMGNTINKFFSEVFHIDDVNPSKWAVVQPSGPALLWSNYFMTSPRIWSILGKFDFIVAYWLDMTYPPSKTGNLSCPENYKYLSKNGQLSTHRVNSECLYCRREVWTNWHRCKVGCHRCWSYVMEQLNVIFFSALTTRVYLLDDSACGSGGMTLLPHEEAASKGFTLKKIEEIFEDIVKDSIT